VRNSGLGKRWLSGRRRNKNWEFDENGFMARRLASINDLPIREADRKYHWLLGRPDEHPGLSELGL
jgi:nuclear transport factor 2 (NTF2) superfamily protein